MKIFDYQCPKCLHIEEVFINSDNTDVYCPETHHGLMVKQIPATWGIVKNTSTPVSYKKK